MVHPSSLRIPRVRRYSGYCTVPFRFHLRGSHTLRRAFPDASVNSEILAAVRTPEVLLLPVWPLPRSLATTGGISVDFFSSPYLDVSVQAVSLIRLFDSPYDDWAYPAGFPHSEIHGSMTAFVYPWLIADCCVLLRLLVPRHSPCALCSLTILNHNWFLIVF